MANTPITLEQDERPPHMIEKRLTADVTAEHMGMLEDIKTWYRSPSIAHAVRLMIEDTYARLKSDNEKGAKE